MKLSWMSEQVHKGIVSVQFQTWRVPDEAVHFQTRRVPDEAVYFQTRRVPHSR
jgi:hypothetical protein